MTGRGPLSRIAAVAGGVALALGVLGVAPAVTTASAEPVPEMKFYDDYWTLQECVTVGEWGLSHGKWTVYDCQESPWDWDLYYDN